MYVPTDRGHLSHEKERIADYRACHYVPTLCQYLQYNSLEYPGAAGNCKTETTKEVLWEAKGEKAAI